jgi:glycosyltransferase involved in cell wall biosynthesis
MRFSHPLGVVCTTELGWRTTRNRWEKLLPLEFENVRFYNPEGFERHHKALGSRSLREMLNTRAAAKTAIAAGVKRLLLATNTDAVLLPRNAGARYFIYMDATHSQTNWICAHRPPKARMKLRIEKMRKLAADGHWFICQSRFAAHGAAEEYKVKLDHIEIAPPPVDTEEFVPGPLRDRPNIKALFMGSRFDSKGGDVLLEACQLPLLSNVEWHFVTKEKRATSCNAHFHNIPYPGTAELVQMMQDCDVLVSPTRADMSPLAAIESQACGLAIVIRNVGATNEIVDEGSSGYLMDRSDAASVADGLAPYLANPELLAAHGAAGRARVVRENSYPVHAGHIRTAVESAA